MQQRCEVCKNFRPDGDLKPGRKLEAVSFGSRKVLLCRAHAGIAESSGVTSFDELRELYSESTGRRSYVPRRSVGAAAKARKARTPGRRASDAA
jgi:hypothetical protein